MPVATPPQKVSVIIVNWNGGDLLLRCLGDLRQQTWPDYEVIVVDNASDDGSAQAVTSQFPEVRLIEAGSNLGFAAGNNLAVRHASPDSRWIAPLNPDAFPEPDWLQTLMDAAQQHPEFAIFGSRLMDANTRTLLDGTGDAYHISGLVWRTAHGQALQAEHLKSREIFSTCAAAGLYRRDVFDELGGFDEDYFCYIEDIDLGFRYQLLGHRCLYVPESVVYHVGSALTGKRSDFCVYYGHRNLVWTFVKNMPGILFWLLLPLHLALNLVSLAYFTQQGQGKPIWNAKRDAVKGLPGAWRKRQWIQHRRRASLSDIWHLLNKNLSRSKN